MTLYSKKLNLSRYFSNWILSMGPIWEILPTIILWKGRTWRVSKKKIASKYWKVHELWPFKKCVFSFWRKKASLKPTKLKLNWYDCPQDDTDIIDDTNDELSPDQVSQDGSGEGARSDEKDVDDSPQESSDLRKRVPRTETWRQSYCPCLVHIFPLLFI